ncbi:unnamed protein product [Didymodactylos carnosus]|uniref:Uncharacterized protein n=1 Tax=Didymodactylos carnosus TaxID=1234261 RepID=A0A814IV39_9BILA|nr:unnamed protein product [Didymodactylos carnosus]CAF3799899.1 unnamed protein product [Didymodactylos carnosus]
MTNKLKENFSAQKSFMGKNSNPFSNLTNVDDGFLEEERKAIDEALILAELEKELTENRRQMRTLYGYSFDEFQPEDILENITLKKEHLLDVETNEDEVTKHFYSNEKKKRSQPTEETIPEETDSLDNDILQEQEVAHENENNNEMLDNDSENQKKNHYLLAKNNSITSEADSLEETINNENEQDYIPTEYSENSVISTDLYNDENKPQIDVLKSTSKQQLNGDIPKFFPLHTSTTNTRFVKKSPLVLTKPKTSKLKMAAQRDSIIYAKPKQQSDTKSRLNFNEVERILAVHKRDTSPNKVQNRLFIPTSDIFHTENNHVPRRPSSFETEYFRGFVKTLDKKQVPSAPTTTATTPVKKSLTKSYSNMSTYTGKITPIGMTAMVQSTRDKRSRSLSEKRLAVKMAKEVEPLPNQPYLWHKFSTKYAPTPKQQKKHISWSPVREYINDGRTQDNDQMAINANEILNNKLKKQTENLASMKRNNQRISRSDTTSHTVSNLRPASSISFIPVLRHRPFPLSSTTEFRRSVPPIMTKTDSFLTPTTTKTDSFLTPTIHTADRTILERKDSPVKEINVTNEISVNKRQNDFERYYSELGSGRVTHPQTSSRLLQAQRFPKQKSDDNSFQDKLHNISKKLQTKMDTIRNYMKKIYPIIFTKTGMREQESTLKQYDKLLEKMRVTDEQLQSLTLPWNKENKENKGTLTSIVNRTNELERSKQRTIWSYFSPLVLQTIFIVLFIFNIIFIYYFNELNLLWKQFRAEPVDENHNPLPLEQKTATDTKVQ